jgi:glucose/mannose transport system substrate-binding protein
MRRNVFIAGLVTAALALAGCGGGDEAGGGGETESTEVEVFTWWTEGGEKAGLDGLVEVFSEQYPDLEFVNGAVAGGAGSNAKSVLASRLQAEDPPDTFQGHAGGELLDYIRAGQIEPLTDLYEEEGWTDVFPADVLDRLTVDGEIYSVPVNVHRANVVWANPTVLADAGISDVPTSIDDWIADLETLRAGGMEAPLAIATDWTQVHLLETVLLADLGPDGYTGLWDGSTDWASADVTAALEHYATLLGFTNSDRSSLDWPDAAGFVTDGTAAYTVMGDWVPGSFDQQGLTPEEDYIWFPVPGTDGVFDFLADSFTLPVGAPNAEGARNWLRVVGSAEGQQAFNTEKGSIPVRTDADPADYGAYQQSALEDWSTDTIVPSLAHGAATSVAWLNDITSAVGQFGSTNDVETFQQQLADAAAAHADA